MQDLPEFRLYEYHSAIWILTQIFCKWMISERQAPQLYHYIHLTFYSYPLFYGGTCSKNNVHFNQTLSPSLSNRLISLADLLSFVWMNFIQDSNLLVKKNAKCITPGIYGFHVGPWLFVQESSTNQQTLQRGTLPTVRFAWPSPLRYCGRNHSMKSPSKRLPRADQLWNYPDRYITVRR